MIRRAPLKPYFRLSKKVSVCELWAFGRCGLPISAHVCNYTGLSNAKPSMYLNYRCSLTQNQRPTAAPMIIVVDDIKKRNENKLTNIRIFAECLNQTVWNSENSVTALFMWIVDAPVNTLQSLLLWLESSQCFRVWISDFQSQPRLLSMLLSDPLYALEPYARPQGHLMDGYRSAMRLLDRSMRSSAACIEWTWSDRMNLQWSRSSLLDRLFGSSIWIVYLNRLFRSSI